MCLQVPEDLARKVAVDGAVAIGVHDGCMSAQDLAAPYLARYVDGKALLKRRADSQLIGKRRAVRAGAGAVGVEKRGRSATFRLGEWEHERHVDTAAAAVGR
jgi:hypothetical protein